jgi:hypothetical protein
MFELPPNLKLNEILQRRADANVGFKLPNMDTWHSWWLYFWQQIDRQPRTMTEVRGPTLPLLLPEPEIEAVNGGMISFLSMVMQTLPVHRKTTSQI